MFDFSRKLAFGLDLSDRSFKIVQFEKQKDKLSLVNFVKKDIPSGLVQKGEIKKEKELISILKNAMGAAKEGILKNNRVVCNLPEEKVFIRVIQLPRMKEEEIAQAVRWEAEAHIPLSINEVYLDWQIIEPMANPPRHIDILIAAAPRDLVNGYLSFLKNSGLQPVALEPESVAVVRSLIKSRDHKPVVIVDLGATGTNFVVFSARAIRFTSHANISGQSFVEAIEKKLKVNEKEAKQLKIKVGLNEEKDVKVYQSLKPIIDDLAKQIGEYIDFYSNNTEHIHSKEKKIEQVILCGGDSLLINLPSYLEKKLKLSVSLGNPLENVLLFSTKNKSSKNKEIIFPKKETLAYNTAIGLALNEATK